jgi:hypothetical protein
MSSPNDHKKIPEALDRRIKLSKKQKEEIIKIKKEENPSNQTIANKYKVSRHLIRLIINPEALKKTREQFKIRRQDGRYKPTKEQWKITMREHRKYKKSIKNFLI